jgi:hypothetical protein
MVTRHCPAMEELQLLSSTVDDGAALMPFGTDPCIYYNSWVRNIGSDNAG